MEGKNERDAERIGYNNLSEEIHHSSVHTIEQITESGQLRKEERGCLPWRSRERSHEPELIIEEILGDEVPQTR